MSDSPGINPYRENVNYRIWTKCFKHDLSEFLAKKEMLEKMLEHYEKKINRSGTDVQELAISLEQIKEELGNLGVPLLAIEQAEEFRELLLRAGVPGENIGIVEVDKECECDVHKTGEAVVSYFFSREMGITASTPQLCRTRKSLQSFDRNFSTDYAGTNYLQAQAERTKFVNRLLRAGVSSHNIKKEKSDPIIFYIGDKQFSEVYFSVSYYFHKEIK